MNPPLINTICAISFTGPSVKFRSGSKGWILGNKYEMTRMTLGPIRDVLMEFVSM